MIFTQLKFQLISIKPIKQSRLLSFFFILLSSFLTQSCVNYFGISSNKKIAPPEQYQTQKSIPLQQGNWPTLNWASQFGDPQLVSLINEALANNPNLQVTKARIDQARSLAEGKAALLLPNVSWQGAIQRFRLSSTLVPPALGGGDWFTFGDFIYQLKYELDIWGKNLANFRKAISQEKAQEASDQQARLSLAVTVASTYNQLAYYYALQGILRRTVAQRIALNKISAVRLSTGLDTKVQLYQSRNSTATAKTQLVEVEGEILLTRQQLGVLVGAGPDRGLSINAPRLSNTNTPKLPPNLPINLLGRRPDIVNARWLVEAACQGIHNAKAQFYPNVNLIALGGFLTLHLNQLFNGASRQYQFGPAISLPIFDGNALRARLKNQYANYEEAVANYNVTLNNALADVATQITTIKSLDNQLIAQAEALYTANKAYNLAKYQYQIGLASQLIVLNAETSLLRAQQTRVQLISNRRSLQIALIKALGGGFDIGSMVNKCCHRPLIKTHKG